MAEKKTDNKYFPALYQRDFRLLWIGQVISFTGTWMHSTAQGWLVYSLTKSPLYLGLVSASSSIPVMLLSLLGGVVADRFRKRNLLMLTQALQIIPALAIGVLSYLGIITVWEVIIFVSMLGFINAFDVPARQSFFAEIVEKGNLMNAIALNSAAFNGARISGPVIAGLTIAYIGLPACFFINALSFLAVVFALYKMESRGTLPVSTKKSLKGELVEGMKFVKGEPYILATLSLVGMFTLFAIPFITLLPVFAVAILKSGPKGFGFLVGSAGVGAFAGAIALAYKGSYNSKTNVMRVNAVLFPAALLAFSQSRDYYLSALCLAVAGWALISFLALANSTIQLRTSDALRGRVMSVYTLVFLGLAPLGNLLLGSAAEFAGTPQALGASSVLCIFLAIILGRRLKVEEK